MPTVIERWQRTNINIEMNDDCVGGFCMLCVMCIMHKLYVFIEAQIFSIYKCECEQQA